MNEYMVIIETEEETGDIERECVEFSAFSSSEAQAYALDGLQDNQRVLSVWQRVL